MESSFSGQQAYLIVENNGQYFFDTDQEATYWVYFTEADGYTPSASFAQAMKMFGFERKSARKYKEGIDKRVTITIFTILHRLFTVYPEIILLYVCSDESVLENNEGEKFRDIRFAKKRSEIFDEWFKTWQKTGIMLVEKIDYCLYDQLYCSCFFKSGNPYEVELRQVIEQTVLAKQP